MKSVRCVKTPPSVPVLIYDGECGFCRRWVRRWRRMTGGAVECAPFQDKQIVHRFPDLPGEQIQRAVHLVLNDGRVFSGAEAICHLFASKSGWPLWIYSRVPGMARLSETAYRLFAGNRRWLGGCGSRGSRICGKAAVSSR